MRVPPAMWSPQYQQLLAGPPALVPSTAGSLPHPAKRLSILGPITAGCSALAIGVLGFAVFAATAEVASAVLAPGVIATESNLKKLQHLEGGMVLAINVREGQAVTQGSTLFRMKPLQAEVSLSILDGQIFSAEALEARLLAERDNVRTFAFPQAPGIGKEQSSIHEDQVRQFLERRRSLEGQIAILESQVRQSEDQIDGYKRERESALQQRALIESELADARTLFAKRLIARTRLLALEREMARLAGAVGQSDSTIAGILNVIAETRGQITQARQLFGEKVVEELRTTRERLADLKQQRRSAQDVLARVDIVAPVSGVVQNLKVSTIGEIVRPGEVLLEIAPTDEALLVSARVRPQDIDGLSPGMEATVRFSALPTRSTPVARAKLVSVSRDRLVDQQTGQTYFLARAALVESSLAQSLGSRLTAGMPAELIVRTEPRTLLDYLLRPLQDAFARGFRER